MRKIQAAKLQNRDDVQVKIDNEWYDGYVLGVPHEQAGRILVPVLTSKFGIAEYDHTEIR